MPGEAVSLRPSFSPVHEAGTGVSVISERRAQPRVRRLSYMSARCRMRLDATAGRGKKEVPKKKAPADTLPLERGAIR
jgi:hypothetical protein